MKAIRLDCFVLSGLLCWAVSAAGTTAAEITNADLSEFRAEFSSSCAMTDDPVKRALAEARCACALEALEGALSTRELKGMIAKTRDGEPLGDTSEYKRVLKAVERCK